MNRRSARISLRTVIINLILAGSAVGFFLIVAEIWQSFYGTQFFTFQARDLRRAAELIQGHLIFFGPEMTGGGNLFGPFYYYLLALPLLIWQSWISAWVWLVLLTAAAGLVGWYYVRARLSANAAWLWLALYSSSAVTTSLLHMFMNVSYLLPFAQIALICICESVCAADRRLRFRYFLAACCLIGVGIQLHFSIVFWLFALLSLHVFSLSRAQLIAGGFAFLAPLAPFGVWRILLACGIAIGQPRFFSGQAAKVVPTLLFFIHNLAQAPLSETALVLWRFVEAVPLSLPIALAVLLFVPAKEAIPTVVKPLLHCAAFGLIPFSYYFVAPIAYRYGIPLYLPVLVLAAAQFERISKSAVLLRWNNLLSAVLLLLLGAWYFEKKGAFAIGDWFSFLLPLVTAGLALFLFRERARKERTTSICIAVITALALQQTQRIFFEKGMTRATVLGSRKNIPGFADWNWIWTQIYLDTGWSYKESIQRIYFIDHHMEQDAFLAYETIVTSLGKGGYLDPAPDGYFVSIVKNDESNPKDWIMSRHVHEDVKRALLNGDLRIGARNQMPGLLVVPYYTRGGANFPRHFHDHGEGYAAAPQGSEWGAEGATTAEKVEKLEAGAYLFRWNECPDRNPYCSTGVLIKISFAGSGSWNLDVTVWGSPLAQTSPWISPNWTLNWQKPFVSLMCGKAEQRFVLADSIGYERRYGPEHLNFPFLSNNSWTAPFNRRLTAICPEPPRSIAVGRESTVVDKIRQVETLPGKRLSIDL